MQYLSLGEVSAILLSRECLDISGVHLIIPITSIHIILSDAVFVKAFHNYLTVSQYC